MRHMLQEVTISSIVSQNWYDVRFALKILDDKIATYKPQGPLFYRAEKAKLDYLQRTMAVVEDAKQALTQSCAYEQPWTFNKLYTAVDTSWLHKQRTPKNKSAIKYPSGRIIDIVLKHFIITISLR